MTPTTPSRQVLPRSAVSCDVVGYGIVQATQARIAELRTKPGRVAGEALPPAFLKHADDQTVAALVSVLQTVEEHQLDSIDYKNWGVIAAPRFLGRVAMAAAMQRFAAEGAWGVSPHLIPHRSLHSLPGTVSQALKINGPNLGVGGGPNSAAEALLAAVALLADETIPGVWVVISAWDPEPVVDAAGQVTNAPTCHSLALALAPSIGVRQGLRLRVMSNEMAPTTAADVGPQSDLTAMRLITLLNALVEPSLPSAIVLWGMGGGVRVELERVTGKAPSLRMHGGRLPERILATRERHAVGVENKL